MPGFDPVSLIASSLLSGASQLGQNFTDLKRYDYDKYNADQLEKLKELQAKNQLGLTSGEQARYLQSSIDPALYQLQNQASISTGRGQDLAAQQLRDLARAEATGNLTGQATAALTDANYQRELANRQELEDRQKYESDRKKNRDQAWANILTAMITGGAQQYGQAKTTNPTAPTGSTQPPATSSLGLPPELESIISGNPELLASLGSLVA